MSMTSSQRMRHNGRVAAVAVSDHMGSRITLGEIKGATVESAITVATTREELRALIQGLRELSEDLPAAAKEP